MKDRFSPFLLSIADRKSERRQNAPIVAVGNVEEWRRAGHALPANSDLHFCSFDQLDPAFIELFAPPLVLTPLVSTNFDCADVAIRLHETSFTGSVRAIGRDVPRPDMIEREVRALCPALDFAIVGIDDLVRLS